MPTTRPQAQPLCIGEFKSWQETVPRLLKSTGLGKLISQNSHVLLKPNLVSIDPPPITSPVELIEAIILHIRTEHPKVKITVAEGCGSIEYDTWTPFRELGYEQMAKRLNVELLDLNAAPLVKLSNPECTRWPEMHLPKILFETFLISVPVLKAHSMAEVTLSMKNMLGVAPASHYNAGSWKKSAFHPHLHEAIFGLNRYRRPDFSILDATVGMQEAHLWGPHCNPKPNILAASQDPVSIDAFGAQLLKRDWTKIPHIKMADGILGSAIPSKIINLKD